MELLPNLPTLPQFEDYSYLEQHRTPTDAQKKAKWLKHREIAWDNTARKYTPMMLRGIRPITFDPWADDSVRFGEERALGFDPWGSGATWDKDLPEVQTSLFDSMMKYRDWRVKRDRLKSVLRTTDEYRIVRS